MAADTEVSVEIVHAFGSLSGTGVRDAVLFADDVGHHITYPVGRQLAVCHLESGEASFIAANKVEQVTACAVSQDRSLLAVCEKVLPDARVSIYDLTNLSNSKPIKSLKPLAGSAAAAAKLVGVAWSPVPQDGGQPRFMAILTSGTEAGVMALNWEKEQIVAKTKLQGAGDRITFSLSQESVEISVSGPHLLRVSQLRANKGENVLKVMPAFSGLEEKTVKITDHAWLESVKGLLAVCVAEGHVYLLSAEELMVVRTIAQPFGATASAVAVGSGDILVPHCLRSFSQGFLIGGADGYVAVWELGDDDAYVSADKEGGDDGKGSGTPPESLYKFTSSVRVRQSDAAVCSLDLTNGEENLLLGFRDSNMGVISFGSLYAPADEQVTCNVIYGGNHCGPITGLDIAVQRPLAASICFKDGTLRVWNYATRVCELQADFPGEDPVAVALHPFGYFVAVAFAEKLRFLHILVRDLKPFKEFSVRGVKLIRFANGGHMLAASQGKLIHIFSSRTLDKVVTLQGHTQQVVGLCFDPEDHFLWSYGQDGRFIEWATQDWTQANSHTNEGAAFLSMASNGVGSVTCSILRGNRCFVQTFKQSVLEEEHEIAGGHRLTTVCQFPGSDAIFAGTENGNLRVYPNLQASGNLEFSEVGLHTGGACSCLCLSTDGRMLITAGEDGAVFVLSVSGIVAGEEAMSMALAANGGDSENARTPEAEAVLATRAEIQRLQSLCQALLAEHGLLRTRIVAEASKLEEECTAKVAEARQKDQAEIQELIRRITALEQASDAKERESQRIMKSMESSHGEAAEQLEHLYERKISHESDRMVVLQLHREKFEAQIQMEFEQLQERLDDSEARAKTELERVLAEGDLDLKKHQDLLAFVQHRFEVLLERGADEHDLEVTRLRQGGREALDQQKSVEGKLRKEQEALLRGLEMMEKDRAHIEKEQQESVTTLKSLREQSEELKRTLASLKDERRDRDSTLRDKEIRIQSYEVKVKTLKKFKHVLDQRLAKVTEELQPKDHLIEQLHQDLHELESEFEKQLVDQRSLEGQIEARSQQSALLSTEAKKQRERIKEKDSLVFRFTNDVHNLVTKQKDLKQWPKEIRRLYHTHVLDDRRDQERLPLEEMQRQMRVMERRVTSLAAKNNQSKGTCKSDIQRKANENATLVHELNELRVQKRSLNLQVRTQMRRLQELEGKGRKAAIEDSGNSGTLGNGDLTAPLDNNSVGHGLSRESVSSPAHSDDEAQSPMPPRLHGGTPRSPAGSLPGPRQRQSSREDLADRREPRSASGGAAFTAGRAKAMPPLARPPSAGGSHGGLARTGSTQTVGKKSTRAAGTDLGSAGRAKSAQGDAQRTQPVLSTAELNSRQLQQLESGNSALRSQIKSLREGSG